MEELQIYIDEPSDLDYTQARRVRKYAGPVWIHGLTSLSPRQARTIAGHQGILHLPDLAKLSRRAAAYLSQHLGELHLDNLAKISDDALREFIAHPNLWIPDDINERIDALCTPPPRHIREEEEGDEDRDEDEDEQDENEDPYASDPTAYDPTDEDAYDAIEENEPDNEAAEEERSESEQPVIRPKRRATVMDDLLRPLARLVGLDDVKATIRTVVAVARIAQQRRREGLSVAPASYHMAFFGPPGTGKTTVARLVAEIFRDAGVLARGHLVETDGQGLLAKYLGQTGHRVREIVERSLGGVLFIDEAYSLTPRDGSAGAYAAEAISTLVPLLETHREDLVVILAGYEEEMNELFTANPGLRSRFPHHVVFPPMDMDQLQAVFENLAAEHGYLMSTRFKNAMRYAIERERRIRGQRFANARAVRTLFESTLARQAERLTSISRPSVIELQTLMLEDLPDQVL